VADGAARKLNFDLGPAMQFLQLLQDQIRVFAWVGNLTHLYLTSLGGTVNYHISNADDPFKQRGAHRHILGVSQRNVPDRFGKDAEVNFNLAGRQGVNDAVPLDMAKQRETKREQRQRQRNPDGQTEIPEDGNRQQRKYRRPDVSCAYGVKRRANAKDDMLVVLWLILQRLSCRR
jgi:hypothetical protein